MEDLEALNALLDKAINEVLQDTTDRFDLYPDSREPDYDSFKKDVSFKGFKGSDKHRSKESNLDSRTRENPDSSRKYEAQGKNVASKKFTKPDQDDSFDKPDFLRTLQTPPLNPTFRNPYYVPDRAKSHTGPAVDNPFTQSPNKQEAFKTPESHQASEKSYNYQRFQTPREPEVLRPPDDFVTVEKNDKYQMYEKANVQVEKPVKETFFDTSQKQYKKPEDDSELPRKRNVHKPEVFGRSVWGALPALRDIAPIKPPATMVVFSTNTGTPPCHNHKECLRAVREIQARHMGEGLADIQYNFLVGGNGTLYEGRGWGLESGVKREPGEGPNYNVAFIGSYSGEASSIPQNMINPVQELLLWATVNHLIKDADARKEEKKLK